VKKRFAPSMTYLKCGLLSASTRLDTLEMLTASGLTHVSSASSVGRLVKTAPATTWNEEVGFDAEVKSIPEIGSVGYDLAG